MRGTGSQSHWLEQIGIVRCARWRPPTFSIALARFPGGRGHLLGVADHRPPRALRGAAVLWPLAAYAGITPSRRLLGRSARSLIARDSCAVLVVPVTYRFSRDARAGTSSRWSDEAPPARRSASSSTAPHYDHLGSGRKARSATG